MDRMEVLFYLTVVAVVADVDFDCVAVIVDIAVFVVCLETMQTLIESVN